MRSLQVTDPTTSTLNVQWEAAEGNVRQYKIYYVPTAGGAEEVVGWATSNQSLPNLTMACILFHDHIHYLMLKEYKHQYTDTSQIHSDSQTYMQNTTPLPDPFSLFLIVFY